MTNLLSKERTILERPFMEFRPFGREESGDKIQDISGVIIKANVDHLERDIAAKAGPQEAARAVETLCERLNERLRDASYHVTPDFLRNEWHSYSYEFTCYVREIGKLLTGDPEFVLHTAMEQHISPLIQVLCRPFSMQQIYAMTPHLATKFSKGIAVEVVRVGSSQAIQRMRFKERAYEQFGPYRKACTALTCQAAKGGLIALPEKVHNLQPAVVKDLSCMVNGDESCTYEVTWYQQAPRRRMWNAVRRLLVKDTE